MTPACSALRRFRSAGVLLIVTLSLPCCNRAAPPAEEKLPPAPVKWEGIRQLFLEEWTELVGATLPLPDRAARVTAPVEGRVLAVLQGSANKPIVEGQLVQKGDVLAQLDATVLVHKRESAEAAKLSLLADINVAELTVKQAGLEVKRLNDLRQQQGSSIGSFQLVAPIEVEKALVGLESAQAHMKAAESKVAAADKEIAALEHEIQLHTLTAPRAGRLGRIQVAVGQTLAIGASVADIVDIGEEIDVLCFVPAADARKLQLGQPARVGGLEKDPAAAARPDPEGKVEYIADQAESESGLLAVKVRFPNRDLKLRANAMVRIRVLTQPGKACWTIPEAALMEDQDPPAILIVEDVETKKNADGKDEEVGKARRLQVVVGMRDRVLKQVEIVRMDDPDKKWKGDLETAMVVVEKGLGVQTGDVIRLEADDDDEPPPEPKPDEKKPGDAKTDDKKGVGK